MSKPNSTTALASPGAYAEPQKKNGIALEQMTSPVSRSSRSRNAGSDVSVWAKIAFNPYFENTTMGVIVFNALWIGIDTEWNHSNLKKSDGKSPLAPASTVVENFFCVYFTAEVIIRFLAFQRKKDCFFDAWFVFDSVLVFFMILETWIMVLVELVIGGSGGDVGPFAALRLLRLLRLARIGRLMKFVPELGKLVKGMIKAARSVFFILMFLVLVIYVFAIIFTGAMSDRTDYPRTPYCSQEAEESEDCLADGEFGELGQDLFGTIGDSFMSLFTRGVLGDNLVETVDAILEQSLILHWLFFVFLIITFATLLNMLIGVVCEVIAEAAAEEEENDTVNSLTETIQDAFEQIDTNDDGLVTQEEWNHIKQNSRVRSSLSMIGVEKDRMEERLQQMAEMLFISEEPDGEDYKDVSVTGSTLQTLQKSQSNLSRNARKSVATTGSGSRAGLYVNELIDKVVTIRPDQDASALDVELMKAQAAKDQKNFKAKLTRIEAAAKKVFNPDDGAPSSVRAIPKLPGESSSPNSRISNNENLKPGNNGEPKQKAITLAQVPTNLLFQAMKERTGSSKKPARHHR